MSQLLDQLLPRDTEPAKPTDVYEPSCVMTWQAQCAAADDMSQFAASDAAAECGKVVG